MTQAMLSIAIDRPLGEVFQFIANGETAPQWQAEVRAARQMSPGLIGVGTMYEEHRAELHQRFEVTLEITEYEINRRVSFTRTAGPIPCIDSYTFSSVGTSTRITVGFERGPQGRAGRVIEARKAADLSTLKNLLEARAHGGSPE